MVKNMFRVFYHDCSGQREQGTTWIMEHLNTGAEEQVLLGVVISFRIGFVFRSNSGCRAELRFPWPGFRAP